MILTLLGVFAAMLLFGFALQVIFKVTHSEEIGFNPKEERQYEKHPLPQPRG
jgi:hypothetical protein